MLKHVDLPAPFGPINASNSPRASSNVTPPTATTPPKALRRSRTASSAFMVPPSRCALSPQGGASAFGAAVRRSCLPPPQPPKQGCQSARKALRERQHQREDHESEHGAPIVGGANDRVLHPCECRSADDRSRQRLHAA